MEIGEYLEPLPPKKNINNKYCVNFMTSVMNIAEVNEVKMICVTIVINVWGRESIMAKSYTFSRPL